MIHSEISYLRSQGPSVMRTVRALSNIWGAVKQSQGGDLMSSMGHSNIGCSL